MATKFAQAIDYYLGEGKAHLPEINRIAKLNTPQADNILLHYAMEGIRLAGTFGLYREATESDAINDGENGTVNVKAGDSVFVSFVRSILPLFIISSIFQKLISVFFRSEQPAIP
jgi:hypothetical protein